MKILTLNTHSLQEENYLQKLEWFVEGILREKPDIIAMQEVNQTACAGDMASEMLEGQYPMPGCIRIRRDNHAAQVTYRLRQAGIPCSWVWLPIKRGYEKYDEGIAILSLSRKIRCADQFSISKCRDYENWQTRAALGVQVEGMEDWFYTVHMSRWDNETEPFLDQWKILNCCLASKRLCGQVWLMGDFNAPDTIPGQSYELITACGWLDTFRIAQRQDLGLTVPGAIDGWPEPPESATAAGIRLDYIWCSRKEEILDSRVVFNGHLTPAVSDHFGVLVQTL